MKSTGIRTTGCGSADRRVCSYVAVLPGAVLLTNSPSQIERFAAVSKNESPAISSLDEFTFFRNRYSVPTRRKLRLCF